MRRGCDGLPGDRGRDPARDPARAPAPAARAPCRARGRSERPRSAARWAPSRTLSPACSSAGAAILLVCARRSPRARYGSATTSGRPTCPRRRRSGTAARPTSRRAASVRVSATTRARTPPADTLTGGGRGVHRLPGGARGAHRDVGRSRYPRCSLLCSRRALGAGLERARDGERLGRSCSRARRCLAVPRRDLGHAAGARTCDSSKLYLWPLLVWTAATRRFAASSAGDRDRGRRSRSSLGQSIGFAGLTSITRISWTRSRSRTAIRSSPWRMHSGYDPAIGRVLTAIVGVGLLGAVVLSGRRGDDLRAFTYSIAAALVLTPVMWQHYLVLLLVPFALSRPRFSALWLVPIVIWLSPRDGTNGDRLPAVPSMVRCRRARRAAVGATAHFGRSRRGARVTAGKSTAVSEDAVAAGQGLAPALARVGRALCAPSAVRARRDVPRRAS